MKSLQQMLRELVRPEVAELAVSSDRLPCVKVDGKYVPVDEKARSTEAIFEMLAATGGTRYLGDMENAPARWTTRVDGLGSVGVIAMTREGNVQARFTLVRRASTPEQAPKRSMRPSRAPSRSAPRKSMRASQATPARHSKVPRAASAAPTSLDALFAKARSLQASDLHVIAGRPPLFRVAGELAARGSAVVDAASADDMLTTIVPERLRAALADSGSCDFAIDLGGDGRFRVNVSRQRTGLKGCFRWIPPRIPTLASLGLPSEIERATHHHQGLVVVTGPTGHGKTTTLAAIVDIVNTGTTHHVITVEDPVEYVHPRKRAMISQREIGSHTRSFASALKASLREDPDVIVVGELRDTETVRMALAASETGHLVLGTMNTPSAAKTIDRLVDLFPPGDQQQVRMTLAGGLHLIVSQRLVPAADGKGMVAAVELLPGSIALWSLIRDAKTFQIPSLQQRGKGFGIVRLDESLAELVRAGRTTREAALAAAEHPDELDAVLSGKRAQGAAALGKRGS
jgi:twitching motility protein PilT